MTVLQKLKAIEKAKVIYNIHYRNAGVGFTFYKGPAGSIDADAFPANWRQYLSTHRYYKSFSQAVNAEYSRIRKGEVNDESSLLRLR